MRNQKLQMMFTQMKSDSGKDVEVLSSNEEVSLLGGNCPMLTSCTTYVDCQGKYKKPGSTTIEPTIKL